MTSASAKVSGRLDRYRRQSLRLRNDALAEMQDGRWLRAEELLWGSLTLAVKGAALTQGQELTEAEAVRAWATRLGRRLRDRRIRDAFARLDEFADAVERARESRRRMDPVFQILEDTSAAVERLWAWADRAANPSSETENERQSGGKGRRRGRAN